VQADPPTLTVYDRLIPCELYGRENFLDLPTDTHRLVYLALMHKVDDFGNLEASPGRLFRWAACFCQTKTEASVSKIIRDLCSVGLVRAYEVESKPYLNLPGFKNARKYFRRHCPPSPWCNPDARTGPYVAGIQPTKRTTCRAASQSEENTHQINATATKSESELPVKVGVRKETKSDPQLPVSTRLPAAWVLPAEWLQWAIRFWADQRRPLTEGEVRAMAQQFHTLWRSRTGRDGRKPDWFATWRTFVRQAGAGDRSLYRVGNGAAPAQHALRAGTDRLHQAG
jgi:hypothetical protein